MGQNRTNHWGPCRVKSEVVYAICKLLHLKGNFKINILHFMREVDILQRGHAWVTRNGNELSVTPAYSPKTLYKIGENDKYCYWVSVKKGRLKGV